MLGKPKITLVGAGNLALALAPALHRAGYAIDEIISRDRARSRQRANRLARMAGARAVTLPRARLAADVVWLCVSDGAIAEVANELAPLTGWEGKYALHSSGALSSGALDALRRRGASVASLHPMMSFVSRHQPSFAGIGFGVEGDRRAVALARDIARRLEGEIFAIRQSAKPLYHAWGAFGSPLLVMQLALAERVGQKAGIGQSQARKIIEPIVRRTIDNYFSFGGAGAFSGPLVRGDIETVRGHLRQLEQVPGARDVYLALARTAIRTLPVSRRKEFAALFTDCKKQAESAGDAPKPRRKKR